MYDVPCGAARGELLVGAGHGYTRHEACRSAAGQCHVPSVRMLGADDCVQLLQSSSCNI